MEGGGPVEWGGYLWSSALRERVGEPEIKAALGRGAGVQWCRGCGIRQTGDEVEEGEASLLVWS